MSTPLYTPSPSPAISTLLGQGWSSINHREDGRSMSPWRCPGNLQTLVTAVTQAEIDVDEDESDETHSHVPTKKKRVYKKRKSTHTVRKEERHALESEIQSLETKLESLKLRALIESGDEDASLCKQIAHNALLRGVIQEHHLVVAKAQTVLMGCAQRHSYNVRPTEMCIHLVSDQVERRETLHALRGPKLQYAKQFIECRSLGLHSTAEYFNEERYETPEGDYCNVRFDKTSLRGVVGGVCAVFEALKHAVFNAEIILSEASGNITIREDDDMENIANFSQMKLITQSKSGVLVENNLAHFSELVQADKECDSYALAAVDFVDKDDRFPYRPHERIRRDATSIMFVTSHAKAQSSKNADLDSYGGHTSSEKEGESVVVMTRWTFSRICRTNLNVPIQTLQEMRDRAGQVSDTILTCVREALGLPE